MIYLLDTNHAIAQLNGDPRIAPKISSRIGTGDVFSISATVLGELYYGAYASHRVAGNLSALNSFRASLALYGFDEPAAEEFGKIKSEQRKKGKPIPTADAQIAAVARLHGFTVLTDDAHFQSVDGLMTDNWLI